MNLTIVLESLNWILSKPKLQPVSCLNWQQTRRNNLRIARNRRHFYVSRWNPKPGAVFKTAPNPFDSSAWDLIGWSFAGQSAFQITGTFDTKGATAENRSLAILKLKWLTGWHNDTFLVWKILRHRRRRVPFHKVIVWDVGSLGQWFFELSFNNRSFFVVKLTFAFQGLFWWLAEGIIERWLEERLIIRNEFLRERKEKQPQINLGQKCDWFWFNSDCAKIKLWSRYKTKHPHKKCLFRFQAFATDV